MKKMVLTLVGTGLLAGALYASGNHMGDHMHNGKMMNHANPNGMTDMNMSEMKKMHKECLALMNNKNTTKSNISSVQQQQINLLTTDNTNFNEG